MPDFKQGTAVSISYKDLQGASPAQLSSLFPQLREAFGSEPHCLGIVVVKDLPADFPRMRHRALAFSALLGKLPAEKLAALESPESKYLVGWSRGKETFMGRPDTLKGSFYVNPTYTYTSSRDGAATDFPEYETPNRWPEVSDLPGFQDAIEKLGQFMVQVGGDVAHACDAYAQHALPESAGYQASYLGDMVATSRTCKARLLHYFAISKEKAEEMKQTQEAWCGEHLDHGCLTGLTSAMFVDESASASTPTKPEEVEELASSPDPASGLYIRNRAGETVKVNIPRDALAFQTGQALEITTNRALKAVPHFVVGSKVPGVSRQTLAVFMQPNLEDTLGNRPLKFSDFARGIVDENYGIKDKEGMHAS
jgi:isopenicillin N synthase-like dioxygenase